MADLSAEGRKKSADKGHALPGGRYPIENAADLEKAIHAVGRAAGGAKGQQMVRRFIIRRAKALGLESKLPDTWNPDGTVKSAA